MKQAAMYVRVSTRQQKEEETIESQKATLSKFARSKGFEVPSKLIFEDNGVSGSTLIRPSLDRLRDYASEGLFDHVFVLSPDRLSRKYAYQVLLLDEFKKCNVTVIFHNSPNQNTAEETMLVQMQGMFAEYERAQITERTRRGKKHKAKNGFVGVLSKASYGYRYLKDPNNHAYLEVNDREASIVKTIFNLYVKERMSIGQIKSYLEEHNILSSTGNKTWSRSTIGLILTNSSYKGIAYYGKKEKCDPDPTRLPNREIRIKPRCTPRRASKKRDRSEWIGIPVPAIIDEPIFVLAQDLLKTNVRLSPRNTREASLLQGLISCKECGYCFRKTMSGKKADGYQYYCCGGRSYTKCLNPRIKLKELDEAVWNLVISTLESPELVRNEISRRVSELKSEPLQLKQRQLEKKLKELEIESNRVLDAFQAGYIEMEELGKRMRALKRETNNAKREIVETNPRLSEEQLLELTKGIEYFSKHLKEAKNNLFMEEKRKILRMLVKDIQIGKDCIEVNHIIPIKDSGSPQIAYLCTGRDCGL